MDEPHAGQENHHQPGYPRSCPRAAASTTHGLILAAAARFPDYIAVEQNGVGVTYAELARRSGWIAHELRQRGIGSGDLVGVCMERTPDMLASLLGVMRAGAGYVPLDSAYPRMRLDMVAVDARLSMLLLDDAAGAALKLDDEVSAGGNQVTAQGLAQVPRLNREHLVGRGSPPPLPAIEQDACGEACAYVIFTSGSTGRPKGVQVTHANVVNLLHSLTRAPGLAAGEAVLALTTISFDIHVLELFLPLAVGGKVLLLSSADSRDPSAIVEVFERSTPALVQATPAQWRMLIDSGFRGHPDARIVIGGEAFSRQLADALLQRCRELWNAYGPTETTVWSAVGRVEAVGPILLTGLVDRTTFHVVDPDLGAPSPGTSAAELLDPGDVGELWIGGAGVTRGYVGRPDLTGQRFLRRPFGRDSEVERVYRTGDLVRRHETGGLEFLGRTDHQVKIRGFRIELGEVEATLCSHWAVQHVVVVAMPDGHGDRKLVAYVETSCGDDGSVTVSELQAYAGERLPAFMVPAQVVWVERMPLTPNGKVDRNALPSAPTRQASPELVRVPPRSLEERAICGVFADVLGCPDVGATDSFFDLGGSSVIVPKTLQRLRDVLGVAVSMSAFLQAPTPQGVAATLGDTGDDAATVLARAQRDAVVTTADRGVMTGTAATDPGPSGPPHTLFMTGASGFVGAHLLVRLLDEPHGVGRAIVLVRAPTERAGWERIDGALARYGLRPRDSNWRRRVSVVLGDVAAPLLGLRQETFDQVGVAADVVLHAASAVNLLYPYEVMRRTNVEGTRAVVRLATTGKPKPIVYTSTLDVFLNPALHPVARPNELLEKPVTSPAGLPRGYEVSKWAAETLLSNASEQFGLQVSILRIGMVVGDSITGVGHETDEWHRFLSDAAELRALPAMDVCFRAVPVNWLSDVVGRLLCHHRPAPGHPEILHLNPISGIGMDEVARELSEFLGARVSLVQPEEWFEWIRSDQDSALYPLLDLFAEGNPRDGRNYFQISSLGGVGYDTSQLQAVLHSTGAGPVAYEPSMLRRSLAFLERKGRISRRSGQQDEDRQEQPA